ncbi:diaminopimelate epimerase [Variovorax sp. PCZ-1]|uniref:diaminopimelate epimerase n=1 Tax=Variovorax sp. PCZ-1 TaxID=2835533 RepID=UPI001BCD3879|nr:diaminopimelate epimerase [Variovorax sp. PCZ-1]MBS7806245.1 diaminopimelate epimerase [Variovorax sp. PCZ-1]
MRINFTKMQGAGNDFVVLDETRGLLGLSAAQYKFLGDRHFGVGADQILSVRAAPSPEFDFEYVIHNNDGGEVEHCGNGARCFVRYVRSKGLTAKTSVRVKTVNNALTLTEQSDGRVTVDMGAPFFELSDVPFDAAHASSEAANLWQKWHIVRIESAQGAIKSIVNDAAITVLSMGNPHAVMVVEDVETAPVHEVGAWMQTHPAFPRRVNAGFMQILNRSEIKLRVYERGAGETLACGTGACAAVVAGIRLGLLDSKVDVYTHGGLLTIEWPFAAQGLAAKVLLTGPAVTVFDGSVDIPD